MPRILNNKPWWVHLLLAAALVVLLVFLFLLSLNWITKHGSSRTVPSVTGKNIKDVKAQLEARGFEVVVQDSVYLDSVPPGFVLRQVPEADEVVKANRTVYLTINRFIAPDIEVPNLAGYSYRNAEMILKNMGLRIGDTTFRPDFGKNSILEVSFNGRVLSPGAKVKMGSRLDLVLGGGIGDESFAVPDLVGMTYSDARALIEGNGLIVGAVNPDPDVTDTATAFVYKQTPSRKTEDGKTLSIRQGQMIDLRLQLTAPVKDSSLLPKPLTNEQ